MARQEFGIDELRTIVSMLNNCTESVLQEYTLEGLINIGRAWRASEWDFPPQYWTPTQICHAACYGTIPHWSPNEQPVHAGNGKIKNVLQAPDPEPSQV